MTDTIITLSEDGKLQLIRTTMRQARTQFPTLIKNKIHIGYRHHYFYNPSWTTAFKIIWEATPPYNPKDTSIELKQNEEGDTLQIISRKTDYDQAAIWISQQLSKAYKKINIQVNTAELTNSEGTWKCGHCGTTVRSTFLSCPVCGANKP